MKTLTISAKHVESARNQACGACMALFVPSEDSGSRVLAINLPGQDAFGALMCGGCFSKWTHGTTVTLRQNLRRDPAASRS
jgi:hypothetical protein